MNRISRLSRQKAHHYICPRNQECPHPKWMNLKISNSFNKRNNVDITRHDNTHNSKKEPSNIPYIISLRNQEKRLIPNQNRKTNKKPHNCIGLHHDKSSSVDSPFYREKKFKKIHKKIMRQVYKKIQNLNKKGLV